MPLEGLQLGHYQLVRLIGSGGMGEVYLAEDTRIRRQVAIKVVRAEASPYPDENATKETTRLFQREMRAITVLDHPHILALFDFGEETIHKNTLTYMVMPFRQEGSLADWLQQRKTSEMLSPQDVSHFLQQAADALQHAHDHQLIHQDVKPSNFLIRSRASNPDHPDLLLADFGIAKFTTATATASQSIRGTPAFMAPEQWDGQPVAATDQYALAVMAYQLLTGRPPFQGGPGQVMRQHFMMQPQPPSTLNSRISKAIDAVILRALEKNPADRFPSISAFADAFQQTLQSADSPAPASPKNPNLPALPVSPALPSTEDLRTTLAISKIEAQTGTTRTLTLPGGRRVRVSVPPGAYSGQVLRLEGHGEPSGSGQSGALVITIAIPEREERVLAPSISGNEEKTSLSQVNRAEVVAQMPSKNRTIAKSRSGLPRPRVTLIIGLVLLIVVVSRFLYFTSQQIPNPYPPHNGTLVLNDPLSNNSNGHNWVEGSDNNGSTCQFTGEAYDASIPEKGEYPLFCIAKSTSYSNFAYQVQMMIVRGDYGAIIFRADEANGRFYYFRISQDGLYDLSVVDNNSSIKTITVGSNHAINTGLNKMNLIAVVANSSSIDLYVNNQHIDSVTDSTYNQGQVGVGAYEVSNPTEVMFSNAKVWQF